MRYIHSRFTYLLTYTNLYIRHHVEYTTQLICRWKRYNTLDAGQEGWL